MASVAKRFILGMAATAKGNHFPAGKTEFLSVGIANHEIALDAQRTIIQSRDLGNGHLAILTDGSA